MNQDLRCITAIFQVSVLRGVKEVVDCSELVR